jgi:uracil-DNA glycosylase
MMSDDKITLPILQGIVSQCIKCDLYSTRKNTVFSRGNPESSLCFIGEAPGEEEDKSGIPFVGRSGELLDKTLKELGLDPETDIYVCNIIKCRPPGNRRPTDEEVNHCIGYLEEQLALTNTKVIVALGNTAVSNLINTSHGISKIRGKLFRYRKIWLVPTYHPSYILRNGTGGQTYEDFKNDIRTAIDKIKENETHNLVGNG